MECHIAVYSTDTIFARMLELEFSMRDMSVYVAEQPSLGVFSEVVLLDLDTARAPDPASYRRMIGFTRGSAQSGEEAHRSCSMIFHRPFEMRLLRREVMGELSDLHGEPRGVSSAPLLLDLASGCLSVGTVKIQLAPKELTLMQCLLERRGEIVSREMIASKIGESVANKTDVYICILRRKLENAFGDRIIRTERGRGYRIP